MSEREHHPEAQEQEMSENFRKYFELTEKLQTISFESFRENRKSGNEGRRDLLTFEGVGCIDCESLVDPELKDKIFAALEPFGISRSEIEADIISYRKKVGSEDSCTGWNAQAFLEIVARRIR